MRWCLWSAFWLHRFSIAQKEEWDTVPVEREGVLIITGQYHRDLRALRWGVGGRWGGEGRVISLVRSALGEGGDNTGQHHGDLGTVLCRRVVITLVSIMATLGQCFVGGW